MAAPARSDPYRCNWAIGKAIQLRRAPTYDSRVMALIHSEPELDDLLSAPSDADRAAMRAIEGGLLILGAGGKMGPSVARRGRRAGPQAGMPAGPSKRTG